MPRWKCRVCCETFGSKAHFINHRKSHGIFKHNGDVDAGGSAAPQQAPIDSQDNRSGDEQTPPSQISTHQLGAPGELSPVDTYQPPSSESSGETTIQETMDTDPQSRSVLLYQMKLFGYLQMNNAALPTPLWVIDESVPPRLVTQHGDYFSIDNP